MKPKTRQLLSYLTMGMVAPPAPGTTTPLTTAGKALVTVGIICAGTSAAATGLLHNADAGALIADLGVACALAAHVWG